MADAVPPATARSEMVRPTGVWPRLRHYLPEGRGLPQQEWKVRHRAVLLFIAAHAIGLPIFAMARGWPTGVALLEGVALGLVGLLAANPRLSRKTRSGLAAFACVLASAMLVQFWDGVIEAHFHFFVVVALISLYQDWLPFLLSIVFVALDHGLTGTLLPEWVYNHQHAIAHPWRWAAIHAGFVLAECVALIAVWRANEEARAETERVLRSTGEGLLGVDAECRVTFANPAALAMAGRLERDLLGTPLYGLLRGDDGRPAFAPDILRKNPGAFTSEAWLARADGARVPVEVLCTPIEGRTHQEGAVVAMRDLTDRLRVEQERHKATQQRQELEQLREVNSFKTRFMNMAAHELNTPLTPIKLQMRLLKSQVESPSPASDSRRSVQVIDRNFERLGMLVQDLLDSTRLQSDRLPVRPEPIDAASLLHELADGFRTGVDEGGIHFEADLQPDLHCMADPSRLAQGVNNLLVNAFKFTPPGGTVRLRAAIEGDQLRVSVQDTGIGLTPDQLRRLFQPFEQVHEAQLHNKGGSGLGLYITRGIIELHGGRIWAESPGPGHGSTFTFEIPLRPPTATGPPGRPGVHAAS